VKTVQALVCYFGIYVHIISCAEWSRFCFTLPVCLWASPC